MRAETKTPMLCCPDCDAELFKPHYRGRFDKDGNFVDHGIGCRCRWCQWIWWETDEPVKCACGTMVEVYVDDDHAYTREAKESAVVSITTKRDAELDRRIMGRAAHLTEGGKER